MSLDDSCEQKVGQSTHFVQRYDNSKCDNSDVTQSTTIAARSAVLRRSFRKDFPAAVRGEGVYVWDANGNKYLDLAGSAAVNFIGHGVPEISAAMAEQAAKLEFVHTSQFTTPVAEAYAQELLAFAGDHFQGGAVYFTCGGSESIETALKLARQYQVEIGQDNSLSDPQPPAELSRLDAGRTVGIRQQAPPRNLSAHGARVRTHRNALLLPLRLRLHRRLPQLWPAIRRGTRTCHRSQQRRGRRIYLRTRQRRHARCSRSPTGIPAIDRGNLPNERRASHRR